MTVCQAFPPCLFLWKLNGMQLKITLRCSIRHSDAAQLLQIKDTEYYMEGKKWVGAREANTVLKISNQMLVYVMLDSDQASATDILTINARLV